MFQNSNENSRNQIAFGFILLCCLRQNHDACFSLFPLIKLDVQRVYEHLPLLLIIVVC